MTIDRRTFIRTLAGSSVLAAGVASLGAQTAPFRMKWANNVPLTHPSTIRAKEAAARIREETNGRVDITIHPDNELGGDTRMLSELRAGAIDFFPLSGLILQALVPLAGINGVAFAFKDYATVWRAMDGDLGALVREANTKVGLHTFAHCLDNGYRSITSSAKPITGPEDLRGFRIRVPVSPLWTSLFKAFGASPVSIDFNEVYTALKARSVEGQENPLAIIQLAKLYEVQKYCSMTGHMWDGQWVLANGASWSRLPGDLQQIVTRHVNDAVMKQRADMAKINETDEADLKAKGLVFNYPDRTAFRSALATAGFYREWKTTFGAESWKALEKYSGTLA